MPGREPRLLGSEVARVDLAERHERPAVVAARHEPVELVAAHGPDLGGPKLAGVGVPREPLRVAVAVGVDLGFGAGAADERVVGGSRAVVAQAQHFADVAAEILREHAVARVVRDVARVAIADRQIDHPVGTDLGAPGRRARAPGIGDEYICHALELRSVEVAARERDRRVAAIALLDVRDEEQTVACEIGMQHDGVHAASAQRVGRPAGYRLRIELAATHDAQIAGQLRHEIVGAAGEKRQMPRSHEPVGDRDDVNSHELACRAAAVLAAVR